MTDSWQGIWQATNKYRESCVPTNFNLRVIEFKIVVVRKLIFELLLY